MVALLGFFFGVIEFAKKMPADIMKICMFGDAATGKTSIGKQYVDGRCTDGYTATIGADFFIKHMTVDGKDKRLQIWGLAQHYTTHTPALHTTDDTVGRHGGPGGLQVHFDITLQKRTCGDHRL